jgi:hypothetical protein
MTDVDRTSLWTLALLVAALLACDTTPSALPYPRLGIQASDSTGRPVTTIAGSACVLLPVLRGSRIVKTFPIAGSLALDVSADRDGALVGFENEKPQLGSLELSRSQLESGVSQEIHVADESGADYVVLLSSECAADAATW